MRRYTLPLLFILLSGCVINGNKHPRPRDLSPSSLIDRVRLLAIQANPPEISPGTAATFTALLIDPNDEVDWTIWSACPEDAASGFGCPVALDQLDEGSMDPETLAEAGIIGIEPFYAPTYEAPEDALDHLDSEAQAEGEYTYVQALAFPEPEETSEQPEEIDFNQIETGFKRLVVSTAATPNTNPVINSWLIDGEPVPDGEVVEVRAGSTIEIGITLSEQSIEEYVHFNSDGVSEERIEEPYAQWFSSEGKVSEPTTLFPFLDSTWIAPEETGTTGTWWAVVRDRRGGISWLEQPFIIIS